MIARRVARQPSSSLCTSSSLYYSSIEGGHFDLYRRDLAGSGDKELLYASDGEKLLNDVSPDGR